MAHRQKKNKYAVVVEEEFDYHGLDPFLGKSGIEKLTHKNIQSAKSTGKKVIRLIVGQGHHSKNGPVIKPIVMNFLTQLQSNGEIASYTFDSAHGTGPNKGSILVKL